MVTDKTYYTVERIGPAMAKIKPVKLVNVHLAGKRGPNGAMCMIELANGTRTPADLAALFGTRDEAVASVAGIQYVVHEGWGGGGRGQGRRAPAATGAVSRKSVTLDAGSIDILRGAGDGDLSRGIRLAAQILRDGTDGIIVAVDGDTVRVLNGGTRLAAKLEAKRRVLALTTTGLTVQLKAGADGALRCTPV
ncbi:hypothetical protein [Cupriavidus sp. TMH.W2]|uniref:hypothetical protein n=1 Tax=Cupriavidus sp. TMH.W2 TaxID=3434465 RepID=UPI003D7851D8